MPNPQRGRPELAGFAPPPNSLGVTTGTLAQTLRLVRNRVSPPRRALADPEKARLRESVLGYEALAETYFFSGDTLRTLHAAMTTLNLSERLGPSAELARGYATMAGITGFFRLRKASNHYSDRALAILANLDDPAAETWVFTLLGLTRFGEGQWEESRKFLANVVAAATRNGDRRRWRDGVENAADIEACRGNWKDALVGLAAAFEAAKQDKDQRYVVMACRERAYCHLQLVDFDPVAQSLSWIKRELERGLGTEELPTRTRFPCVCRDARYRARGFRSGRDRGRRGYEGDRRNRSQEQRRDYLLGHIFGCPSFRQSVRRSEAERHNR